MRYTRFICHRKPERSFHIKDHQFPVCARCTGFYIAMICYFLYTYNHFIDYNMDLLIFAVIMMIPTLIDGTTQLNGTRESNNALRFFTGLIGGLGLGIIFKGMKYFIYTTMI
ncbi:DUF2085 domain-containing protein [uncultured Methanobrevibacter sp.]|uniref:DUF2085 domain-containing protein n=1 Tax=uncultured Methanobrevibacter sp. TaxID=253161 RepID=UPI0026DF03B0|nr:DUF2085 domain-containing protein [uncultured Methanobrevibacter sp.]